MKPSSCPLQASASYIRYQKFVCCFVSLRRPFHSSRELALAWEDIAVSRRRKYWEGTLGGIIGLFSVSSSLHPPPVGNFRYIWEGTWIFKNVLGFSRNHPLGRAIFFLNDVKIECLLVLFSCAAFRFFWVVCDVRASFEVLLLNSLQVT